MPGGAVRTLLLTVSALVCFAANSLLCRAALQSGSIDAGSFTVIRIMSGALLLALLASLPPFVGDRTARTGWQLHGLEVWRSGSWVSALALIAYAGFFSYSYLRLDAGIGALVLFGMVQATMIGWSLARRRRPGALESVGLVVAVAGLVLLTVPGKHAPNLPAVVLMAIAGMAWGIYSFRGRSAAQPLRATAGNFLLAVPMAAALGLIALPGAYLSARGVWLAATSGAVTSGIGYSLWYAALPSLGSFRAAIVQLAVPVLASIGAVLILGETLDARVATSGVITLAGVATAIMGGRSAPSNTATRWEKPKS